MDDSSGDFCFCTLALSQKYINFARRLAEDLNRYASGKQLIVFTDNPKEFDGIENVQAFEHHPKSIEIIPYNDKRFPVAKALSIYKTVVYLDADLRVIGNIEEIVPRQGVLATSKYRRIFKHTPNWKNKKRKKAVIKICKKLSLDIEKTYWCGERSFIVSRDNGKEDEFIEWWGKLEKFFGLKGLAVFKGNYDGNCIGIAAAMVGWSIQGSEENDFLQSKLYEAKASSYTQPKPRALNKFLPYLGRLYKVRIEALKEFRFYYL